MDFSVSRIPTDYNKIKDLTILDSKDLLDIELRAKSLSLEETLESLFLSMDELSEFEQNLVKRIHRRGRHLGVQDACENLFTQMKTRNGTQACIEYLQAMSASFHIEATPDGSSAGGGSGFTFNIFPSENEGSKPSSDRTASITPMHKTAEKPS